MKEFALMNKTESRKKNLRRVAICLSSMATRRKWRGTFAKNGACCPRSTNSQSGGGCFFCPNARDEELRHLRKHHPDLWEEMMKIQTDPETVRPGKFRVVEGLRDIERNFELEENQISFFDFM